MAEFSQNIECKYGVDSYQDIKNTYDWILKSAQKLNLQKPKVTERFSFKTGEILCTAENITEFSEYAYGSDRFKILQFAVFIYDGNEHIITVIYTLGLNVVASNKANLERFVSLLQSTFLTEPEINDPISVTYIGTQNNGVVVTGNGNVVAANQSTVSISEQVERDESKLRQWLRSVGQNLLSNGIWYLITLVAGAIIGIFVVQ